MKPHELMHHYRTVVYGWSMTEAAERLGWPRTTLIRKESGETELTLSEIGRVADVYHIAIERLHGYEARCTKCGSAEVVLRQVKQ